MLLATAVSVEFAAECSLRPTGTLGPLSDYPGSCLVSWRAESNRQSSVALPAITKADEVAGRPHQPCSPSNQRAQPRRAVKVESRQEASSRVRRASTATERLDRSDLYRCGLDRVSVPTMTATSAARPVGVGTVENRFGISWRRRHSETVRAQSCRTVSKANAHRRETDGQQGWELEIPTVYQRDSRSAIHLYGMADPHRMPARITCSQSEGESHAQDSAHGESSRPSASTRPYIMLFAWHEGSLVHSPSLQPQSP